MTIIRRNRAGEPEFSERYQSESRLRVQSRAPATSGQFPLRYTRVRETLLRYLSPILVDSVLSKALKARNLSPATLTGEALIEVTGDIMVGLRLFVQEERLPRLMLELADILGLEQP